MPFPLPLQIGLPPFHGTLFADGGADSTWSFYSESVFGLPQEWFLPLAYSLMVLTFEPEEDDPR
jgi:hypothetical protein